MKTIRIENLRSLSDTSAIELKPITLLIGQNNSGKSTFLRSFPLLRQSVEAKTTGPILWFGQYVDFGDFDEAVSTYCADHEIIFHFEFPYRGEVRFIYGLSEVARDDIFDLKISLRIARDSTQDITFIKECILSFTDQVVEFCVDNKGAITKLAINGQELSDMAHEIRVFQRGLVPHITNRRGDYRLYPTLSGFESIMGALVDKLKPYFQPKTKTEAILKFSHALKASSSEKMLSLMKGVKSPVGWKNHTTDWDISNPDFITIKNLIIANTLPTFLAISEEYLTNFFRNSKYIAPVRATAERYYRVQDLSVDEVDSQGRNLAMFLRNLSSVEQKSFSGWTETVLGFSTQTSSSSGHISVHLIEVGTKKGFNLADMGFGYSQVLPILIQLWALINTKQKPNVRLRFLKLPITLTIEQPELHLHPRLQAKMADVFVNAINIARDNEIDLRLVIETHSEALVNRMGHLVAKGDITPADINVVLFEKADTDSPTVIKNSEYDSDGFLKNWPLGFFDVGDI